MWRYYQPNYGEQNVCVNRNYSNVLTIVIDVLYKFEILFNHMNNITFFFTNYSLNIAPLQLLIVISGAYVHRHDGCISIQSKKESQFRPVHRDPKSLIRNSTALVFCISSIGYIVNVALVTTSASSHQFTL